jgi:DNA-nicking Smr family endonuclease
VTLKTRSLAALGELKRSLDEARRDAARRRAEVIEATRRKDVERRAFAHAVGPVTPLPGSTRRDPRPAQPSAEPRQRQRDEQAALAASLSDEFDPTSLLHTDAELAFHRPGVGADVPARLRRGQWSIQRQLDLHGLTREQARETLAAFLQRAERDGLRCVRIVHGKGNGSPGREGVLKAKVRSWLVQKAEVIAFAQARAADGGHGALLVLLRGTRA